MGFKTRIKVNSKPVFSETVLKFELNRLRDDDYIFNDEFDVADYRIHLGTLVGLSYPTPNGYESLKIFTRIANARPTNSIHFNSHRYIEKLSAMAKIPDETIELHIKNGFTRDSPYWNEYKQRTIEYLKAKRDYIKNLVNCEIESVELLNEPYY